MRNGFILDNLTPAQAVDQLVDLLLEDYDVKMSRSKARMLIVNTFKYDVVCDAILDQALYMLGEDVDGVEY